MIEYNVQACRQKIFVHKALFFASFVLVNVVRGTCLSAINVPCRVILGNKKVEEDPRSRSAIFHLEISN